MSIKKLSVAIKARYDSSDGAALRALVSGMWRNRAPHDTKPPYITFSFPAASTELVMTTQTHDVRNVTFSIWDADPNDSGVTNIGETLMALYDDQVLTLTGGKNVVYCNRMGDNLLEEPDKGFSYHIQYEYRIG